MGAHTPEKDAAVEWGVRMPDGRIEVCASEPFARRFARNDPRREVVTRTVTPWVIPPGEGRADG